MTNDTSTGAAFALTVLVLLALFAIFWRTPEQRRRRNGDRQEMAQANYSQVVADAYAQRMIKTSEIDKIKAACARNGLAFFTPPILDELVAAVMCQTHRSENERYTILDEIHLGASHYAKWMAKQIDEVLREALPEVVKGLNEVFSGLGVSAAEAAENIRQSMSAVRIPDPAAFTIHHFTEQQARATGRKAGRMANKLLAEAHGALQAGVDHDMLKNLETVGFYVDQHDAPPTVDQVVDFLEGKANDHNELVFMLEAVGCDLYLYYLSRRRGEMQLTDKAQAQAPKATLDDWRAAGWSDQQLINHGWASR